ncbi:MAG: hypothetical protein JWO16_1776 [Sphingomonas bacterium]|nr:hypothetical protein [Sphingomonas bacterium]
MSVSKITVAGIVIGISLCPEPSQAQNIVLTPLAEARLRGEHVDQAGLPDDSDAVTLRIRTGLSARRDRLSALIEVQGTFAIGTNYYDGLTGPATRPLVGDPQNIGLYRAQLQYKDKRLTATIGRQRISLDDDRFVDSASFRQNSQSYDAARIEWVGLPKLRVDLSYVWSTRTAWGIDGFGVRPAAVPGDTVLGEVGYASPIGSLTAFGYLISQNDPAFQGYRLSSQTWGLRFAGIRPLGPKVKWSYKLSYARQAAWRRNPNDYAASFYLIDTGLDLNGLKLGGGYEVAGASNGIPFTSVQFPLGSGFRYRGWAGKLNPTPPDGVRDLYASIGYGKPQWGSFKAVTFQAAYHRFDSDRLVRHYGDELDLLASGKLGRYTLAARFAGYDADLFATRTRKFWLQLDWAL